MNDIREVGNCCILDVITENQYFFYEWNFAYELMMQKISIQMKDLKNCFTDPNENK